MSNETTGMFKVKWNHKIFSVVHKNVILKPMCDVFTSGK